jgi:hypothetical protein
MATQAQKKSKKTYSVDFYRVRIKQNSNSPLFADTLRDAASTGFLEMVETAGTADHHQVKSIVTFTSDKVFKAVFGKVRKADIPKQGDEHGNEEELNLKPGYGLVEKNYFMFYRDTNLLVYQRNQNGSHYSKLAQYLSKVLGNTVSLDPVLTADSYARLMQNDVVPTKIELSLAASSNSELYPEDWTQDMMDLIKGVGGARAKLTIRADTRRGETLVARAKEAAVILARSGLASISRVSVEDNEHPIDLIADRIKEKIEVEIEGRYPDPESIYNALMSAKDRRQDDLDSFFGK